MPDITMCEGVGCTISDTCYRAQATPSEFRQSYFIGSPVETVDGVQSCDYWCQTDMKRKDRHGNTSS